MTPHASAAETPTTALAPAQSAAQSPAQSPDLAPGAAFAASAVAGPPPPARFRHLLVSEWIKTRSLRSTPWTLALAALFVIGCSAVAALADRENLRAKAPDAAPVREFLCFDAYPVAGYMTLMLVAGSMGVVSIVGEYSSGMIRTTTVAVPARHSVVLAKAAVVAALWTVVGAVISTGSFLVSQAVLDGVHAGVPITHPGVARAVAASTLLAPVCALVGLGLGVLIRHTAAALVATLFTLVMLPTLFSQSQQWSADVNHMMVAGAWKRLVQSWADLPGSPVHDATVSGSWAVYGLWPPVVIALALFFVRRRDV
ncbi:ABC transporter permease subunit [Streptomyces sp. NPDC006544]|uniref:ABC transporter permease subunit n=1 Tax=Streptomyces sp. NPDC006544 TaxID=3154583 RepID=UPI0033B6E072